MTDNSKQFKNFPYLFKFYFHFPNISNLFKVYLNEEQTLKEMRLVMTVYEGFWEIHKKKQKQQ